MANRGPEPQEFHRVIIELDGRDHKGKTFKHKQAKYKSYMRELRRLAGKYKAEVVSKELLLRQAEITRSKKALMKGT